MVDKTTVIKAGSAGSSFLPAIAVIGVGYLGYKAISGMNFGGITGGIAGGITERIESFTTNIKDSTKVVIESFTSDIKDSTKVVYDNVRDLNDGMNDNYITNLFAPDIQRKEDMTDAQKWSLSELKKGNVNYNTISGGKLDKDAGILDIVKNAWSKETLANTQIMFLPKGKDKPLSFLSPSSSSTKVSTLTSKDILSNGLSMAPIAQNTNSAIASDIGVKTTTKTPTAATGIKIGDKVGTVTVTEVIKAPSSSSSKTSTAATGTGDNKIAKFKSKYR